MNEPETALGGDVVTPTSPPVPEESHGVPTTIPAAPGPDPILAMIERAARDASVDIEKFERLMTMKERLEAQRASVAFAEAFANLQPELPAIDRRGRIVVFSKADREKAGGVPEGATPIQKTPYATLDDILEALRAPLARHGFSLRFEHDVTADGRIITKAVLRHRAGHEQSAATPPLKHDTTGSKNDVQAVGSALTYGRRYALMAVLPIVSHAPQDADDDGKGAGSPIIDADQLAYIEQQLRDTGSDVAKFLGTLGADPELGVAGMTVKQYQRGLELIAKKKRKLSEKQPTT